MISGGVWSSPGLPAGVGDQHPEAVLGEEGQREAHHDVQHPERGRHLTKRPPLRTPSKSAFKGAFQGAQHAFGHTKTTF